MSFLKMAEGLSWYGDIFAWGSGFCLKLIATCLLGCTQGKVPDWMANGILIEDWHILIPR